MKAPCDEAAMQSVARSVPCGQEARGWVLAATILGSSFAFIDSTVVNVALPALQASFRVTVVDLQWVVESYGVFLAALILVGGSFAARFGRRLIFVTGVLIFAVASAGCGIASGIHQLILARRFKESVLPSTSPVALQLSAHPSMRRVAEAQSERGQASQPSPPPSDRYSEVGWCSALPGAGFSSLIYQSQIELDPSALTQTKWHEYAVRFFFGGLVTVIAGIIAKKFGPVIGGLFLAFPAIFPASATLIEKHEKEKMERHGMKGMDRAKQAVSADAAGSAIGSIGLAGFAWLVWRTLPNHSAWLVLPSATFSWLAVSVLLWVLRKRF